MPSSPRAASNYHPPAAAAAVAPPPPAAAVAAVADDDDADAGHHRDRLGLVVFVCVGVVQLHGLDAPDQVLEIPMASQLKAPMPTILIRM